VIRVVGEISQPIFLLWGEEAKRKKKLILRSGCTVVESAHPAPRSAYRGFFGSRPFCRANASLVASRREAIDWNLGD
jgi:uracil-DNA glycosylase